MNVEMVDHGFRNSGARPESSGFIGPETGGVTPRTRFCQHQGRSKGKTVGSKHCARYHCVYEIALENFNDRFRVCKELDGHNIAGG
jgi:hypothetical protein